MDHSSDRPRSHPGRSWTFRPGRPSPIPTHHRFFTGSDDRLRRTRRHDLTDSEQAVEGTDGDWETVEHADSDGNCDSDGDDDTETPRHSGADHDDDRAAPRTRTGIRSLMTSTDDRQVLVVGDGVAGLAVTATLRRVGYDPVLLAKPDRTRLSRLAVLHPLGQSLLDDATTDTLRTDDSDVVRLDRGDGRDGSSPAESRQSVALTTDALETRLATGIPDASVREDGIRTLEREGDALRVRFESGVREWFDLVVAADGPGSTVHGARATSLDTDHTVQTEAHVDADAEGAPTPREVWTDRGFVQTVPHPRGGHLVRLTSSAFPNDDRVPIERVRQAGDALGRGGLNPSDLTAVRKTEVMQCPPGGGHWGDGRVAYCGGAALSQAPATGLGATLALADARVFADELLAGPPPVSDAVDAYGRRRRRYLERLREAATDGPQPENRADANPALASVRRFRSASRASGGLLADPGTL